MTRSLNPKTKGFSIVGVVVIVAICVAVVFGGWYVYRQHNKNKPTASSATSTTPRAQTHANTPPADPTEGGKYLVIKEWGVRVPLSSSLRRDVIYGLRVQPSGQIDVASFEVGKLTQLAGSKCKLFDEPNGSGKNGGIGVMLIRKAADLPAPEGVDPAVLTSSDGQYKYYATGMKALCASSDRQLQLDTGEALTASLKQLQQVQE